MRLRERHISQHKMFVVLSLVIFVACTQALPAEFSSTGKVFDVHETILEAGFPVESHDIITSDGYILELIRIPYAKNGNNGVVRPPVLMMHGLTASANAYTHLGPQEGLAYNLVNLGLDVWLGNARGVANSRRHISLDPDHSRDKLEFFDFTWEDIAIIDVAAMVDYILEKTNQQKLHYVGHSQGGTVFLVLNSLRPEYNDKFISAHLLAGVGYQNHFPEAAIRLLAATTDLIYSMSRMMGRVEVFGPNADSRMTDLVLHNGCANSGSEGDVCARSSFGDMLDSISGAEELIAGAALKQFAHYGQNIRDKSFRRYNHGSANQEKYGASIPPEYDLSKITVDVTMHYTVNDNLLSEQDVLDMVAVIPNAVARKIARETFTHTDFIAAPDAKQLVVDYIVEKLSKHLNKN